MESISRCRFYIACLSSVRNSQYRSVVFEEPRPLELTEMKPCSFQKIFDFGKAWTPLSNIYFIRDCRFINEAQFPINLSN